MTILSRYLCFVNIFLREKNTKAFRNLLLTLENAMKISFSNYYSSELSAYNGGANLAYDLQKYFKRYKLQLVYCPEILDKIDQQEQEESNSSYKSFKASKGLRAKMFKKYKGKDFEDEEFLKKFPEKKYEKLIRNKETTKPLVKKIKDEEAAKSSESTEEPEHTSVYLKRDALYSNMKTVNISVESSSTVDVILDFLKNKIVSKDQVRNLKQQNRPVSTSQRVADILERARREFTSDEDEEEPSRVQSMLEKITIETLNESGQYASMDKKEKQMLFNELESLLSLRSSGMRLDAPPSMKLKKKPNEEEKRLLMEEEKERKGKGHHDSSLPGHDENMNFFGKFNKKFPDRSMSFGDEVEAEGEEFEEDTLGKHINTFKEKTIDPPEKKRSSKIKEEEESEIEEKIDTTNKDNMDIPIELESIQESDDVVYEFYYNRTKIPSTRTIYELINYQPSHRQITDQYIIYYRILDRSEISDDTSNTQEEPSEDDEIIDILTKEKELMKTILQNSSGFSPVIAEFMKKHISPYVKPDHKQKSIQNTNSYSLAPPAMNSSSTKIGVSEDEQRLISKKSRKVCDALMFILEQWDELKLGSDFIDKDLEIPKPDNIFKNLLDEYVQKILMEPLNLVLHTKKSKIDELFDTFMKNPYLLGFETRALFFKTAAFAQYGEFHRSIRFLIQYREFPTLGISKSFRDTFQTFHKEILQENKSKQSLISFTEAVREVIKINRKNLLESAVKLFITPGRIKKKSFCEIQYCNEEGTGLGPTLEFYYL